MTLRPGKNIRLFENPILEKLTYVHPVVPIAIWGPVVAYCFSKQYLAGALTLGQASLTAFGGLLFWSLAEYVLHRFVFHFEPHGKVQERIAFLIHGIHHDDPGDQRRLLMPPIAAILIAAVFYGLFYLVLGTLRFDAFFAGFIVGYLCYDYIHFATHFARPKSKLLKALKQNHMNHHFIDPDKMYGVSNPFWDYVFKTQKRA